MKQFFFAGLSLLMLSGTVKAQNTYIQGGVNFANISKTDNGETNSRNALTSFNAGIMHQFGLSSMFDVETGLLLTGKGAKAKTRFNGDNDYVKTKFNPLYIELALNLMAKFPLGNASNVFVHAGPYAAVGVGGKAKTESRILGISSSSEQSIDFSEDDPTTSEQEGASYSRLKRFDYGLNFGGGLTLNRFIIKANYGLGLAKINSMQTDNSANEKNKFRTVSLSVGIPLGGW
jgi:hypothetical protein